MGGGGPAGIVQFTTSVCVFSRKPCNGNAGAWLWDACQSCSQTMSTCIPGWNWHDRTEENSALGMALENSCGWAHMHALLDLSMVADVGACKVRCEDAAGCGSITWSPGEGGCTLHSPHPACDRAEEEHEQPSRMGNTAEGPVFVLQNANNTCMLA